MYNEHKVMMIDIAFPKPLIHIVISLSTRDSILPMHFLHLAKIMMIAIAFLKPAPQPILLN